MSKPAAGLSMFVPSLFRSPVNAPEVGPTQAGSDTVSLLPPRDPRDGTAPPTPPGGSPASPLALARLISGNPALSLDGVTAVLGAPIETLLKQGPDGVLYNPSLALSKAALAVMTKQKGGAAAGSKAVIKSAGRVSSAMSFGMPTAPQTRRQRPAGAVMTKAVATPPMTSSKDVQRDDGARLDTPTDRLVDEAMAALFAWARIDCDGWRQRSPDDRLRLLTYLFYDGARQAPSASYSPGGGPVFGFEYADEASCQAHGGTWTKGVCVIKDPTPTKYPKGTWTTAPPGTPGPPPAATPGPPDTPAATAAVARTLRSELPEDPTVLRDWIDERCWVLTEADQAADWLRQLQAVGITCAAWLATSFYDQWGQLDSLRAAGRLNAGSASNTEIIAGIFSACRGVSTTGTDVADNDARRVQAVLGGDCAAWDALDKVQQTRAVQQAFPERARNRDDLYRLAFMRYDLCHPVSESGYHGDQADRMVQWVKQGPYMPPGGPDLFDAVQGAVGDCYFVAAMASVAWTRPDLLLRNGQSSGPDRRRFVFGGVAVDVSERTPCMIQRAYGPVFANSTRLDAQWPGVVEKAYAAYRVSDGTDRPNIRQIDNSTARDPRGGNAALNALPLLIGGGLFWYMTHFRSDDAIFDILGEYCDPNGRARVPMVASSYSPGGFVDRTGIVPNHAYSVLGLGFHPDGRKFVVLRNPWGYGIPNEAFRVPTVGRWLGRLNLNSGEGGAFAFAHGAFSAGFQYLYGTDGIRT